MRFYVALSVLIGIFAALVAAAPNLILPWPWSTNSRKLPTKCMTEDEAHIAADIFRMLIQEYSHELAMEALTEDFVDWASSVNILINKGAAGPKSMNAPTFASRAAFMDGQGKQPQIPFETIRVFPGCRHVAMRWKTERSGNGHLTEVDTIVRSPSVSAVGMAHANLHLAARPWQRHCRSRTGRGGESVQLAGFQHLV